MEDLNLFNRKKLLYYLVLGIFGCLVGLVVVRITEKDEFLHIVLALLALVILLAIFSTDTVENFIFKIIFLLVLLGFPFGYNFWLFHPLYSMGPIHIRLLDCISIFSLLIAVASIKQQNRSLSDIPLFIPFLCISLIYFIVFVLHGVEGGKGLRFIRIPFQYLAFFILVASLRPSMGNILKLIKMFILTFFIMELNTLYHIFFYKVLSSSDEGWSRAGSYYLWPLAAFIPLIYVLMKSNFINSREKILSCIVFYVGMVLIVFTLSKSVFLPLFLAIAFYFAISVNTKRKLTINKHLLSLIVGALIIVVSLNLGSRYFGIESNYLHLLINRSNLFMAEMGLIPVPGKGYYRIGRRAIELELAYKAIKDGAILGYGPHNNLSESEADAFNEIWGYRHDKFRYVHTFITIIFWEVGIIGFFVYLLLPLSMMKYYRKYRYYIGDGDVGQLCSLVFAIGMTSFILLLALDFARFDFGSIEIGVFFGLVSLTISLLRTKCISAKTNDLQKKGIL